MGDLGAEATLVECPCCKRVTTYTEPGNTYCLRCVIAGVAPVPGPRRLICTVGLPRSGKSTWAKDSGYPIVNPDSIRLAIHGQAYFGPAEPWVWAMAGAMVEALFLAGHQTVILDATNISSARRQPWINNHGAYIVWKAFYTTGAVCKERALATGQEYLLPVIDRMMAEWDFGQDLLTQRDPCPRP